VRMDPFIEAEQAAARSTKRCCELFEVSRAAYYQRKSQVPSARQRSDAELIDKIRHVHDDSDGTYGSPRVHHELLDRDVACGRHRVRRLMRQAGLEGRCKKWWRKTTIADPATHAEALGRGDLSLRPRLSIHQPGLPGPGQLARRILSLGRKGTCWDNAVAESFFATIKRELIDRRPWPTINGLRREVFDWIEGWYNTRRLHSSLGYLSPARYEARIHHNQTNRAA
jgi:transposase InsO family protein